MDNNLPDPVNNAVINDVQPDGQTPSINPSTPSFPEGAPISTKSGVEKASAVEALAASEKEVVSEIIPASQEAVTPVEEKEDTPNELASVVDKKTSHKETKIVEDSANSLTKDADEEEKDFIEHVEEVHSIA